VNWLKKKVIKWVREDWESAKGNRRGLGLVGYADEPEPVRNRSYESPDVPGMDIRVQNVTGGMIVSVTKFNTRRAEIDYPRTQVYLLREEENLGEALAKIITQESLRG
jgi:hypothetical protein